MIIKKNSNIRLITGHSSNDFDCKCTNSACNITIIDEALLDLILEIQKHTGQLWFTNAYRCIEKNKAVGGSELSQHRCGAASDIAYKAVADIKFGMLTDLDLVKLFYDCGAGFVKLYTDLEIIHIDVRKKVDKYIVAS